MINEIVNNIKSRLGASHRKLELDDRELVQLLQNETLHTLSIYNPFFLEYSLPANLNKVDGSNNTFNLPEEIEGFRTIGVENVFLNQTSIMTGNGMAYGILGNNIGALMSSYMDSKMINGLQALMLPPDTFRFIPPNILRIFNNYPQSNYMVIIKTTHRKDFSTFPYGLRETIMKLALADVANDLLGIRGYFQSIGSTFADINLNLDLLNNWADKRDDIIESLRKNQLKNTGTRKIYMA
jgi:hypothetical protein